VQTDKTRESLIEFRKELADVIGSRPLTSEEIAKVRNNDVRALPGNYESIGAVASAVLGIVHYGYPDDYVQKLKGRIEAQTDDGVRRKLAATLTPDRLTWVIVGDLSKIESAVRELGIGEVTVIDADGKPVR
jgi:predicted Zn-dependent peptidase